MRKLTAVSALLLLTGLVQSLERRIEEIASEIDSTVGVAALHIESGRRIGLRESETFPMGSVYKFPIAIAFLREVDAGRRSLSDEITIEPSEFSSHHSPIRVRAKGRPVTLTLRELLHATVRESDNTAANVLLRLSEGTAALLTGGRDDTTPAAMLDLLERFHSRKLGLSPASHELLVRLMTTTSSGQRRIQAGTPVGAAVAHKTGTLPGTVNDVGIITSPNGRDHVLIAVFTKGGRTSTMTQRERAVASITRAVYRDFIGWPASRRASARE